MCNMRGLSAWQLALPAPGDENPSFEIIPDTGSLAVLVPGSAAAPVKASVQTAIGTVQSAQRTPHRAHTAIGQ
jgi:hypothetical protein